MTYVQFVLICEGGTDEPLVEHLEKLLIWVDADEVNGVAPDFSRLPEVVDQDVRSKLEAALRLEPGANLILIHRDADSAEPGHRYEEIQEAVDSLGLSKEHVPVVPVQETEAWLLLDEDEIRRAAGNPNGTVELEIPKPSNVEDIANAKERLHELLLEASEKTGRQREKFQSRLPSIQSQMLRRLSIHGRIEQVPAWRRMRDDLEAAIEYM